MGYWKDVIEQLGGGNPTAYEDSYVCARCFDDESLKGFIEGEAKSTVCSFCGFESDEPIAAPLVELLLYIKGCLDREYDVADNWPLYDSESGDYFGDVWTTRELLQDEIGIELPNDDDGKLIDALCGGLGERTWCRKHPLSLTHDERLSFSWDEFCDLVKHKRHYFFLREERHDDELYSPLALLRELTDWCERFELIKTIPHEKSVLYHARPQETGEHWSTPIELGPPPPHKAKSSRMSPPGIVMFYVADNAETALRETAQSPGEFGIGQFKVLRDVRILDLAHVPSIPSIFASIPDALEYDPRPPAIFLSYFATELSKPITRDERVHIEYIPTQVITEYFRTEFLHEGQKIDGIRYCSARHSNHYSLVMFATQEDLVDGCRKEHSFPTTNRWIEMTNHLQRDVTATDLEVWNREAPQQA